MFAKALYLKHYGYLLDDPDIFQIFFPGTYHSTRESKHNDVIVISGKKGSGKTELAKFMAYVYHEKFPRNRVIVFSGIKDLYADLPWAIKVDLKEVEKEEQEKSRADYSGISDASEFRDSLVIFDDVGKNAECQNRENVVSAGECACTKWKKFWDQCHMYPSSSKQRAAKHNVITRSRYIHHLSKKL
jgi:energy-coupling factor transporter ATP-binding protein EcfA2